MPVEQPPITIGEITTVPQPESGIRSPWAQTVSGRVTHRFATTAAMAASNLPIGALATVGSVLYQRITASAVLAVGFARLSPYSVAGAFVDPVGVFTASATFLRAVIPASALPQRCTAFGANIVSCSSLFPAGTAPNFRIVATDTTLGGVVQGNTATALDNCRQATWTPSMQFVLPAGSAGKVETTCSYTPGGPTLSWYRDPAYDRLTVECRPEV